MSKELIALRLEPELIAKIKEISPEGNVSQWIRLLIKKEIDEMTKKELLDEMLERFEGTYSLTQDEIETIRKEFDFTPNKGLKIFIVGTGTTNSEGKSIRKVFLGPDGYNEVQHICYI